MVRPCFLVIDQEFAGNISTRKLIIETAKLNVVTAYSGHEAIETLRKFPLLDGVVLDAGVKDMPCNELVTRLKQVRAEVPVAVVGRPGADLCDRADHYLPSFDPKALLQLLQSLRPVDTELIRQHENELAGDSSK